ncbi:MAG: TetR family transcriptional regulator [Meiothermus sp.]|uniref:TetR family transcriptional regulator n=2 Tax=Meiothermus sp. TaxID=1955249 RepID=UPI0025E1DB00|nr:TetR family transcriptional regulator [Meiothermus sp.]MCS7057750.1 TetR family transcriptional regulator [Meiothermus sp.]MDW8091571.1 TetR family transcriptional regulator [Meiothermus sp.]
MRVGHRLWLAGLFFLMSGFSLAQGVRSLGMAGLVLPGPGAAYLNPAYAAYPAGVYGSEAGFQLPLGLLGILLRPESNPIPILRNPQSLSDPSNPFDFLSFYDQLTHINSLLINPASSTAFVNPNTGYPEIQIIVEAGRIQVTDYQGRPLNLDLGLGRTIGVASSVALTPAPLFRIPLLQEGSLYLELGPYAGGFGLALSPNSALRQALAAGSLQPNTEYAVTLNASGLSGVGLSFGYATRLPELPIPELGRVRLYTGGRGEGFYGLAYLESNLSVGLQTDAQGQIDPNQPPVYRGSIFYTYPGNGNGFGLRADLGVVAEARGVTVGLGIRNLLGFARWSGTELVWNGSSSPTSAQAERSSFGFVPAFFLNAATKVPLEMGQLTLGGDLGYETRLYGRIGGEYALGPGRFRAGLGFDDGFRIGLGAGVTGPGFSLDAALTTHRAPLVGHTVFGIAMSLGLNF